MKLITVNNIEPFSFSHKNSLELQNLFTCVQVEKKKDLKNLNPKLKQLYINFEEMGDKEIK